MQEKTNEKRLLLLGAGIRAKMVIEAIEYEKEESEYSEIALLDSNLDSSGEFSCRIIGKCDEVENFREKYTHAFACMLTPAIREDYTERLIAAGLKIPNIIHPRAYVSRSAELGKGIFVHAMATVQANAKVGDGCLIDTGAIISHDAKLGKYVQVAQNATTSSFVKINNHSYISECTFIRYNVKIGENVFVTAGSIVASDIPNNVIASGCPAKVIRQLETVTREIAFEY